MSSQRRRLRSVGGRDEGVAGVSLERHHLVLKGMKCDRSILLSNYKGQSSYTQFQPIVVKGRQELPWASEFISKGI
jgi:hypothetical protein